MLVGSVDISSRKWEQLGLDHNFIEVSRSSRENSHHDVVHFPLPELLDCMADVVSFGACFDGKKDKPSGEDWKQFSPPHCSCGKSMFGAKNFNYSSKRGNMNWW